MIAAQNKAEDRDGIFDIPTNLNNGSSDDDLQDSMLNILDDDGDMDDLLVSTTFMGRPRSAKSKDEHSLDESMSLGDESTIVEGKKLVTELHRIRGLLGNVLERKGNPGGAVMNAPMQFPNPSSHNEQEVERLRAQLHEQAVTTSLRKADSTFLQSQLNEKDKLLKDVSQVLEAVEKRQVELESENERLKQEYTKSIAALKSKESEVLILEKLMKKRETEIKKLKQRSS